MTSDKPDPIAQFLADNCSVDIGQTSWIVPGVGIVRVTVEFELFEDERDDERAR